jgi:hypothetical protein
MLSIVTCSASAFASAGRDLNVVTNFCCTGVCSDNAQVNCNYSINATGDERIFTAEQLGRINFQDYGLITKTQQKKLSAPTQQNMVGVRGTVSLGDMPSVKIEFVIVTDFDADVLHYTIYRRVGNDPVWREFGKMSTPVTLSELYFYITPDGFALWSDKATQELHTVNLAASVKPQAKM